MRRDKHRTPARPLGTDWSERERKTNILKAFVLLRSLSGRPSYFGDPDEITTETRLRATFLQKDKRATLTADIQLATDEHNVDEVVSTEESWYAKDFTSNRQRATLPLWIGLDIPRSVSSSNLTRYPTYLRNYDRGAFRIPESFQLPFRKMSGLIRGINYYNASQFTNPSRCPVSFEVARGRRFSTRSRGDYVQFLHDMYDARQSDSYNRFFEVVGPGGTGLVDGIEFNEIPTSSIEYKVRTGGKVRE